MKPSFFGIEIEILEIDNGFIVKLFTKNGDSNLDKTKHAKNIDQVLNLIKQWHKELLLKSKIHEIVKEVDE